MSASAKVIPFPQSGAEVWIEGYRQARLVQKDDATVDAYLRILRQCTQWIAERPGHGRHFEPTQLTQTSVELYLSSLKEQGYSVSHRTRVKSVINHFCQWLIEDKEVLRRNPTRGVEVKVQQTLAPRILSPDQRFVLRTLIEKDGDLRGKAIFALGYWAGCRVSDIAHLRMEHAHIGPKIGWLHVGHKGEKFRDIDLLNEARRPLYDYLRHVTVKGTPAIRTTARYTQVSRAHVREKLKGLKG